jgi:excisionase family DNA binding protein
VEKMNKKNDVLTIDELAEYLRLQVKSVYRLVKQKKIPGIKIGGSWRFSKSRIIEWIEEAHEDIDE